MKPSELIKSYILSKQLPKQQNELSKYFECCFERLDNNFIDREEIKDKINKQIKEVKKVRDYPYSYKFLDTNQKKNLELECKYKIEAKKEILELIK